MDGAAMGGRPAGAGFRRVGAHAHDGGAFGAKGVEGRACGAAQTARGIRKGDAMNLLQNWVETPGATALVWTLIHSLWEGAAVALLLAVALCVLRGSRARYAAACIALLVLLAGFGLTFANLLARQESLNAAMRIGPLRLAPLDADAGNLSAIPSARDLAEDLPWIAAFWIAGVVIFHLRSLAG